MLTLQLLFNNNTLKYVDQAAQSSHTECIFL